MAALWHRIVAPNGVDPNTVPVRRNPNAKPSAEHRETDIDVERQLRDRHTTRRDPSMLYSATETRGHYGNRHPDARNYTSDELNRDYIVDYGLAGRYFIRRLLAEMVGTFVLVYCQAAALANLRMGFLDVLGYALAAGLIYTALIYALGEVSGAHFNPAVTLAFALRGVFPIIWVPFYWLFQFIGALIAAALVHAVYENNAALGTNGPGSGWSVVGGAFACEILLSFFLIFIIMSVTSRSSVIGHNSALAIGAVMVVIVLLFALISSASGNPFRSLGPYLINGPYSSYHIWPYVTAPFIGAIIAVIVTRILNGLSKDHDDDDYHRDHRDRTDRVHAQGGIRS